jgi:adenylate cyclase
LEPKSVERRLAAILAADVVGYSRLMGADEVGTLRALKGLRRDLVDPAIAGHRGRIVKTTGDGILIDFASAVDAVACAFSVQRRMLERNKNVPEAKRIVFRVGINVGDIIIDRGDIFGDGVNIAARLEALCEPGGLCVSRDARNQVRDKLPLPFADLGEQQLKNIARPVHVFGVSPEAIADGPEINLAQAASARRRRPARIAAAILVLGAAVGGAAWLVWSPTIAPPREAVDASITTGARSPRASIAVLPLVSLVELKDDYFVDGLTEDIISALGRFAEISVRSRNAVYPYKGKTPRPEEVGRELDVRYIVEGSIRQSREQLRVSIRLTDASRGAVLWSQEYEAETKDIFVIRDDITRRITGALAVRVTSQELAKAASKPPRSLEAYDLVLRGRDLASRWSRSANSEARSLFERAIKLDPTYLPGYVGLGHVELISVVQGWTANPDEALQRAEALGHKGIEIDESNPGAHALLGGTYTLRGEYDRALDESKRAVELNPSDADSYAHLGGALLYTGDVAGATKALELAVKSRPTIPWDEYFNLGTAYLLAGRNDEAIRTLERSLIRKKMDIFSNAMLAAAYAEAGRQEDATRQAETVRRLFPFFVSAEFGSRFRIPAHREKIVSDLQKAGL